TLVALLCAVAFVASGLFTRELKVPDEVRVAEIGREMAVTGDWLVPHLDGTPFLEEPPLAYAAIAQARRALGASDVVARLPSCLATIATLLLAFGMARRLGGDEAGLLAVLVLASLSGFQRHATSCQVDGPLMLAVTLGQAAWLALLTRDDGARLHPGAVLLLHVAAGVAFLVKGVVGPALLYGPLLVDLVWHRRWALLRSAWHVAGAALGLALAAAWPLALHAAEPALLHEYLEESVLGRLMPGRFPSGGHTNPPTYYFVGFPGMVAPWVLAAPALVAWLRRAPASDDGHRAGTRALASVFPVGLLLLSIPGTRRTLYLLPLLPSAAVACAAWLASARRRTDLSRLESLTLLVLVAPFALLAELPARLVGVLRGTRPDPFAVRPLLATVRQGRSPPAGAGVTPARLAWAYFGVSVAASLLGGRFQDPDDRITPIATDLARLGAVGDALVGFRLDERTRAIVPLRTGQLFENVEDPSALAPRLAAHPGARILVPGDQADRLPPDLRGRLVPVGHWTFGRHEYVLLSAAADETRTVPSTSR
ncbi:MAG TPA: glycosyltransferase family 39 protein, partial [Planctomycetota bacterium]|nr:glycosyltransferase family 39 protein [Planctomycetota bacterium]